MQSHPEAGLPYLGQEGVVHVGAQGTGFPFVTFSVFLDFVNPLSSGMSPFVNPANDQKNPLVSYALLTAAALLPLHRPAVQRARACGPVDRYYGR